MRLFCAMEKLSWRNRKRLAPWQEDPVMTSWCSEMLNDLMHRLSDCCPGGITNRWCPII